MKKNQIFFYFSSILLITSFLSCGSFQPYQPGGTSSRPVKDNELRSEIVTYARKYEGTRYKYAGMSPKGFDCSGFTCYVMSNFGIDLTHQSGVQETEGKPVSSRDAQAGDLVFFRKRKGSNVFHVALIISNGPEGIRVIHATSSRGVVIDNIEESSYWSSKYATIRNVIDY